MKKHVDRGFEHLRDGDYEIADREFRKADCRGGRSLVAFKERGFERAMNQACKCLDAEEDHFPYERDVALKVIEVSLEEADPEEMQRPEIVTSKAEDRIDEVSWEEVDEGVSEFIEDWSLFSELLADESSGRDLKNEKIEEAFELIRSGRFDEGFNLFADLHDSYREDPFWTCAGRFRQATWRMPPPISD